MKILLLGATGLTGRKVAQEAISNGHTVHALVPDTETCNLSDVVLFEGTPYIQKDVATAIKGCDAVIDTLSNSNNLWGKLKLPKDMLSISLCHVVREMRNNKINRLVSLSKIGVGDSKNSVPFLKRVFYSFTNARFLFSDHFDQENRLQFSGLNWSVVRAGKQIDSSDTSGDISIQGGKRRPLKDHINSSALAHFLLQTLNDESSYFTTVAVSNS